MQHTLGTAAKATGLSKATIHRAIKSGKLSALRQDDGSFKIDPSELARVYELRVNETLETVSSQRVVRQSETPTETVEQHELAIKLARLEVEIAGLKDVVRLQKDQVEDLRTERDRLLGQVEAAHRLLTHEQAQIPQKRKWWFGR